MLEFITSWRFILGVLSGSIGGILFARKNKDGVNAAWYVIKFYWRNFTCFIASMKEKKTDGSL